MMWFLNKRSLPTIALMALCSLSGACGPATMAGPHQNAPNTAPICELETILFEFNSYNLNHRRLNSLVETARCINRMNRTVEIRGHCSQGADEERNILISKRRAESIRLSLIDLGVPETLLRLNSMGGSQRICTADNDLCHEQNNRVNLVFVAE